MELTTLEADPHAAFLAEVQEIIRRKDRDRPRSKQQLIGPSEVGQECARRLAYKMMRERRQPYNGDPWASITGTKAHEFMADAFGAEHERRIRDWARRNELALSRGEPAPPRVGYLIEVGVEVRPGLFGTCDLYDIERGMVVDWKNVGATSLKMYREQGPSKQYRVQAHLYGAGLRNAGHDVKTVAIVFFSRSGGFPQMHMWSEPWSQEVVDKALARVDGILELATELEVSETPENYQHIPAKPSRLCHYCPYFKTGTDVGRSCPGE